jgi:hypothetical protein
VKERTTAARQKENTFKKLMAGATRVLGENNFTSPLPRRLVVMEKG